MDRKLLMKNYQFTTHIEKDNETQLYIGYIPSLPGAHTQGATLDELQTNLKEVVELCLEELTSEQIEQLQSQFIGTQEVRVAI